MDKVKVEAGKDGDNMGSFIEACAEKKRRSRLALAKPDKIRVDNGSTQLGLWWWQWGTYLRYLTRWVLGRVGRIYQISLLERWNLKCGLSRSAKVGKRPAVLTTTKAVGYVGTGR
jgi:hypothetical protein